MARLIRAKDQSELLSQLTIATDFWSRSRGLLGKKMMKAEEGLWLKPCSSIHTLFMKFSIGCVFVDRQHKVVSCVDGIQPWRLVGPIWGAHSCIEVQAGLIRTWDLQKGEVLSVVN